MKRLNKRQRYVLIAGIAIVIIMGMFPPWIDMQAPEMPPRFGWFLSPPTVAGENITYTHIDMSGLTFQWTIVSIITGLAVFAFKTRN